MASTKRKLRRYIARLEAQKRAFNRFVPIDDVIAVLKPLAGPPASPKKPLPKA